MTHSHRDEALLLKERGHVMTWRDDGTRELHVPVPKASRDELVASLASRFYRAAEQAARERDVTLLIDAFRLAHAGNAPVGEALQSAVSRLLEERLNDAAMESMHVLWNSLHYLGFVDSRVPECVDRYAAQLVDNARHERDKGNGHQAANQLHVQLSVLHLLGYRTGKFLQQYAK